MLQGTFSADTKLVWLSLHSLILTIRLAVFFCLFVFLSFSSVSANVTGNVMTMMFLNYKTFTYIQRQPNLTCFVCI